MSNKNSGWDNFFLGFTILVVISGIYLTTQGDYVSGICGAITGLFLIYLNRQNKNKHVE